MTTTLAPATSFDGWHPTAELDRLTGGQAHIAVHDSGVCGELILVDAHTAYDEYDEQR